MDILTWNIQSGLGCDKARDLVRIIGSIDRLGSPDIICLQEVARFFPEHGTSDDLDQLAVFTIGFPKHQAVWSTGMRWFQPDSQPQEFGNLTLVKGVVLDSRTHCLPMPPGDGLPQMPRVINEAIVMTSDGPLRVLNTHLAYHNEFEKRLQIDYLCELQQWAEQNANNPPRPRAGCYANRFRTSSAILCGDLNLLPDSEDYLRLAQSPYRDAWRCLQTEREHPPTCGVHDHSTWPEGPHCRDYCWITDDLEAALKTFTVDLDTSYSDHQPMMLSFDLRLNDQYILEPTQKK